MKASKAVQKLCHSSDDWFFSNGNLGIAMQRHKGKWHVTIFPSVRERMGGRYDGKRVYSPYFVCVETLMKVFDTMPMIQYESGRKKQPPFLCVHGTISGEAFIIRIVPKPPPGTPVEVFRLPTIDEVIQ